MVLFISTASAERVRARAITKTRLGDATRTHGHCSSAPSPSEQRGGRRRGKKKEVTPGLGWRSRGQRFFPACRPEKTYVFLRHDHRMRSHHPSTFSQIGRDRSRRGTHHGDDDGGDDDGHDEPAQGRPVAHSQKFFTANNTSLMLMGIPRRAGDHRK